MLLSLLGTWLTSPLIPFEVAPQVCSHSISALSSCETRSHIFYYLGKAACTECRGHNEKIQCPISTAKYLTSKLKWKMKLIAWRGAGKGLHRLRTGPQWLLALQHLMVCRASHMHLFSEHSPLPPGAGILSPPSSQGAETWGGQVTWPDPTWPDSRQFWSAKWEPQ